MSAAIGMEQIADMVAYYRAGCGVKEVAAHVGFDAPTVWRYVTTYGGVIMRPRGHYAQPGGRRVQHPRPNSREWRCNRCHRGEADGAARSIKVTNCRSCLAAMAREYRRRKREGVAS